MDPPARFKKEKTKEQVRLRDCCVEDTGKGLAPERKTQTWVKYYHGIRI